MMESLLRDIRQPEYLHVLLNPLPVYGLAVALLGLMIAIFSRSRRGQMVTLALVLITSGSAWPVFELGERSSDRVLSMSDEQGGAWLKEHEHRADQVIAFFYVLSAVSLAALLLPMKFPGTRFPLALTSALLGLVVLGMGAYIAQAGGKIRHKEFRNVALPKERAERGD